MAHTRHQRNALFGSLFVAALLPLVVGCARFRGGGDEAAAPAEPVPVAADSMDAGMQAAAAGDRRAALAAFERAIEINPTLTEAHMAVGDIHRETGDYEQAEPAYARAAELEPANFDAQYYHALTLHLLDRVTEAVRAYLRALAIRPDDFEANLGLASAYYQLDESAQGLDYARRAVTLRPEDGPARYNLGAIYASLGRHGEAVDEFQQATEHMELGEDLLLALARSLSRLGRYEEMRNALAALARDNPSPAVLERLGFATFKLQDYEQAASLFSQALAMNGDYYPALNGLGVCLLNDWIRSEKRDRGARAEGVALLRRSLQINDDQPRIVALLARYGR